MSKKDAVEVVEPEVVEPEVVERDLKADAISATVSARSAAIAEYMRGGYKAADGKRRNVRSVAHAEFLARAGEIELP